MLRRPLSSRALQPASEREIVGSVDSFVMTAATSSIDSSLRVGAQRLSERYGLTPAVARWLARQPHLGSADLPQFFEPRLTALTPPDAMADRDFAAVRLARAVRSGERVAVFGDYDCDGITSTAILSEALQELGVDVSVHLASRFAGGYGLSGPALDRLLVERPSLLVTCDCGSSDHESLRRAVAAGVEVIVIDHHLVPAEPLPAVAFLNPHRPECGFPYKGLASCGLALSTLAALRKELGVKLDVRKWLDLVAIGTIADVAPLTSDNRVLVRAGLAVLAATPRPGLRALLTQLKLDQETYLTGRDVAFRIAPQLNAPGRLGAPDLALHLLTERDPERAQQLCQAVLQASATRREQQEAMVAAAIEEIEAHGYASDDAIVVGREGWNHGIVGIVAGRLAERYGRAVAVIGFEDGVGRGSVRAPRGSRLYSALQQVADCLERFGGHQAAAGLTLAHDRLATFRARFPAAVRATWAANTEAPEPMPVVLTTEPFERVLADLHRLEPCGEGNPRPELSVEGQVAVAREVKGGHLKLELTLDDGRRLGGFGPGLGSRASELIGRVRVLGDLRKNHYPGAAPFELYLRSVESDDVSL